MNILECGLIESNHTCLKLDSTSSNSQIVLSDNELFTVYCNFQYLLLWLKRKRASQLQIIIIELLFSNSSNIALTSPLKHFTRLATINLDIKSFKKYILSKGYFKVFDKQLVSYVEYIECKQVDDNPAIAIGTSKMIYYYKSEVIYEQVLAIF